MNNNLGLKNVQEAEVRPRNTKQSINSVQQASKSAQEDMRIPLLKKKSAPLHDGVDKSETYSKTQINDSMNNLVIQDPTRADRKNKFEKLDSFMTHHTHHQTVSPQHLVIDAAVTKSPDMTE